MRTEAMKSILAIGAVCMIGGALQAQTGSLKAHIPFAFEVQSKVLLAGDYTVAKQNHRNVTELVDWRTRERCYIATGYGKTEVSGKSSIVFHRYGNTYFLSEIRASNALPVTVPASKREKEMMHSPRGAEMALVSVTILAD